MEVRELILVHFQNFLSVLFGLALFGMLATPHQVDAAVILQDEGTITAQIEFSEPLGQSFVAEDALVSFAFWYRELNLGSPNDPLEFRLYDGAGTGGPLLFSHGFGLAEDFDAFYNVDLSSVALTIGQTYTAAAFIPGGSERWGLRLSRDDPYASGQMLADSNVPGCGVDNAGCDLRFRVTPRTVSVPEPGSLAILSLGLVGFGVARRRRAI
ncbi:PEP-CTERM sorting domain-containing protein [Pelagibius sp. Alg239-R121]|uniref:PEP-CTERM sorting domain-containing protein n=1 Tax=Pelagibius sp. Alg239-R121 TaxID=2993448 RepID=UPI0024A74044|nr:PEP-CTERM sorting domain-containing protein [Pelagibius sp. Alg239-R121]